jgi:hypothetical protein
MNKPSNTQEDLTAEGLSSADKYRALVVGRRGLWPLIKFELVMLFASWVPGALGLLARSKLYPTLLDSCGRGVVMLCFGTPTKFALALGSSLMILSSLTRKELTTMASILEIEYSSEETQ